MTVVSCVFLFVLGLIFLVSGSSLFVDSAVSAARKLHISEVIVGATIVSLGTTLPEILFSTTAAFHGYTDMAIGNALGSILCNTGFIAGILICVKRIWLSADAARSMKQNLGFLGFCTALYVISFFLFSGLPRFMGVLLVLIGIWFLKYSADTAAGVHTQNISRAGEEERFTVSDLVRFVLEAVVIYIGAQFLLTYGPELARFMGIPEIVISLTFVAAGTSLPELVTSLVAMKKGHASLSLGNILGADILNLVFVGGLSALLCPIPFSESIAFLEIPFIILLVGLLCIPSIIKKKTGRWQGVLLVLGYALYLWTMMHRQSVI